MQLHLGDETGQQSIIMKIRYCLLTIFLCLSPWSASAQVPESAAALRERTFEDYKMVDGVNTWHTMKQSSPAVAFTVKIEEIKNNVPVEDAKFAKPAGQ